MTSLDSFKCQKTLKVGGKTYVYYSLPAAEKNGLKGISKLPYAMKVLLENLLRNEDGRSVTKEDIQAVAQWLKTLGLIHDFRVEALATGSQVFQVKVRKSPESAEVLITDVGFGVSQILPVFVLCFYVPEGSTVILEQPEIHLHPTVQAGLADVLVDAWQKRKVQILLESHSEHLLRRLQRRIAEKGVSRDDIGLFFCRAEGSGSKLTALEVDLFGKIRNWPEGFFGDEFGEIAAMSKAAQERRKEEQR